MVGAALATRRSSVQIRSPRPKVSAGQNGKSSDLLFVFGLIPLDLSVAIGERSALRSFRVADEQQEGVLRDVWEVEPCLASGFLVSDRLPATVAPIVKRIFVIGIYVVSVAATEP